MSMFFNKKKSSLKISNPINFNDVTSPASIEEVIPTTNKRNKSKGSIEPPVSPPPFNKSAQKSRRPSNGSAIILITKYNFQAHNSKELTVSINEPLKLLSRQGNGWLLVKPIGRLGGPGLVPSTYCSMVDNGSNLNEDWLNGCDIETSTTKSPSSLNQKKNHQLRSNSGISESSSSLTSNNSMDGTSPTSVSSVEDLPNLSKQFPLSLSVNTVSSHRGRYWYRTDVIIPNNKTRCLCRYYQDFYSLHASLHSVLHSSEFKSMLPKLPGPIPRPDPEVLLQRCHDLNAYTQRLIEFLSNDIKEKDYLMEVFKAWLSIREGDVEIDETTYTSMRTEDINKLIDPVSPNASTFKEQLSQGQNRLQQQQQQQQQQQYTTSDVTPPLKLDVVNIRLMDSAEPSPITSSENTSPIQSQPETPKRKQLTVDTRLEYSPTSPLFHHDKPKLDFITERRTRSPVLASHPGFKTEEYIKVKVIYNDGNDIIAMKMLKDSNLTILKLSISSKIHIYDYVLSYKDVKSGFFKPLRTNKDLEDAVHKSKIVIKVNEANVV